MKHISDIPLSCTDALCK